MRNAQSDSTAYDTPRQNLTFVAVTDGGTLGGHTPISALNVYGGGAAAGSIADAIVPTGAASRDQNTMRVVSHHPDVLQVFTETEASAITPPAGVTDVFPYGFIVRRTRVGDDTRVLPADPAPGIYDGVVTFAFTMPLQATAADDPFTVSALFAAYDDGDTRVTQSVEEQSGIAAGEFAERAANLGATSVSLLPGGRYAGTTTAFLRCDVRATGTAGSPTAYVHEAASADPWLVTDPFGVTGDGPAFLPPTARIRAARCGGVWSTPTASSFVVHGMQSGPPTGSYIGTGGDSSTPSQVTGGVSFTRVAAGLRYTCGVTPGGTAYCWSGDTDGALGNGAAGASSVPSQVVDITNFARVTAGEFVGCGVTVDGGGYCWGRDTNGQLGNGETGVPQYHTPQRVRVP